MNKCNHPDCFNGVKYELIGFGLMNIGKCEYCSNEKDSQEKKIKHTWRFIIPNQRCNRDSRLREQPVIIYKRKLS